jgi:phosphate:Na+ symporter
MLTIFSVVVGIIGSVALFLYSVISFGKEIKHTAGYQIKSFLSHITSNPVKGIIFGAISTAILQSSSATSVIIASLADTGLISFYNTLGVIFGVNIGTTITSQLVAFNAMSISPFIILFGFLIYFWGNIFKKYGKTIIYFGFLFFSIYLISIFTSRVDQEILGSLLSITSNPLVAILIGVIASIAFQSSSIVSGIVLILAGLGHIDLTQSVGLILGANIGTTSTVIIASLTLGKEAKKVALSHFMFNFLGVLILLPFLSYFYEVVKYFDGEIVHQVANIHLIFNLACTFIFLLAIKPFSRLINFMIK